MPVTSAASYIWLRNFGGNPAAVTAGTTMQMFDVGVGLSQFWWSNQFTAGSPTGSGIFLLGPLTSSGLFRSSSTTPVLLQSGLVPQAFFSTTQSTAGSLDAPDCRPTNGSFFVHEVSYAADGSLSKLAADFSGKCSLGYATYVQGGIRYRSSVAASLDRTIAVPGTDRTVNEGQLLRLEGSLSWNMASRLKSLVWTQLSGPVFDLSVCQLGICDTYTPLVAKGGADAVFQLTATSESGQVATANLRIKVQSWQDTQSRADIWGKGYIAGGSELSMSDTDGQFEVPVKDGSEAIYANQTVERIQWRFAPNGNSRGRVTTGPELILSTASGTALTPGQYSGLSRAGFTAGSTPAAGFSFDGHACNTPAWTALLAALDRNPADLTIVNSGAVTLSMRCLEAGELDASYGRLWIRYTPVSPPVVKITAPKTATAGQSFVIQDAGSTTPAAPAWLAVCQQIFGINSAVITFRPDGSCQVVPDAATPDNSKLVIVYEVIDAKGQTGVALTEVLVTGGPASSPSGTKVKKPAGSASVLRL